LNKNLNIKLYLQTPGQAVRVPGGSDSQISGQSAHEGNKFVRPMHRPPLSSEEMLLVLISVSSLSSRLEATKLWSHEWRNL